MQSVQYYLPQIFIKLIGFALEIIFLVKCLIENVHYFFYFFNVTYPNNLILYETPVIMILNSDVFYSWRKQIQFYNINVTLIVFKESTKEFWLWNINVKDK